MLCQCLSMSVLALLDFSSGFDQVNSILVHCLHTDFGYNDTVPQWFSSYLIDGTHYISLSNYCSALDLVNSSSSGFSS